MDRTADAGLVTTRLAFWGYTNDHGVGAALNLARQFRICDDAVYGSAEFTSFFCDVPEPISDLMTLAVRGAGGPSRYDGNWDALATALPNAGRGFDAIVCTTPERLGRIRSRLLARLRLAAEHGVVILSADQPIPGPTDISDQVPARLQPRVLRSLRDYTTVKSIGSHARPVDRD